MEARHFFVDEAGDLTIFDRLGRSKLGHEGVSRCFLVGVAEVRDPAAASADLEALRYDDTRVSESGMRYAGEQALRELACRGPLTTARFEESLEHTT
jgi:hypothetical protein